MDPVYFMYVCTYKLRGSKYNTHEILKNQNKIILKKLQRHAYNMKN